MLILMTFLSNNLRVSPFWRRDLRVWGEMEVVGPVVIVVVRVEWSEEAVQEGGGFGGEV